MSIKVSTNKRWNQILNIIHNYKIIEDKLHEEANIYTYDFEKFIPSEKKIESYIRWSKRLEEKGINKLIVIGIGGSSLGIQAIYNCLEYSTQLNKKLIFWEAPHPRQLRHIIHTLEDDRVSILWISKSGYTFESLINLSVSRELIVDKKIEEFFITSDLDAIKELSTDSENIFLIPKDIVGRYSIYSAVGLLPLLFLGQDINLFLDTFKNTLSKNDLSIPFLENPAKKLAWSYYKIFLEGYRNHVFWIYIKELHLLGKWLQQLWLESLGKTPLAPISFNLCRGPEDQHSSLQYYLGADRHSSHTFISNLSYGESDLFLEKSFSLDLKDHSISHILNQFMESVIIGLDKKLIPVCQHSIDETNIATLPKMFAFWMQVVRYISFLLRVNPYNQNSVDNNKNITKSIFTNKSTYLENTLREQYEY